MAEFARYTVEKFSVARARRAVVLPPGRQPRARARRPSGCASCIAGRAGASRGASRAGSSTRTNASGCGRSSTATRPGRLPRPDRRPGQGRPGAARRRPAARPRAAPGSSASTPSPASGPTTAGSAPSSPTGARSRPTSSSAPPGIWGPRDRGDGRDDRRRSSRSPTSTCGRRRCPSWPRSPSRPSARTTTPSSALQDRDLYFREHVDRLGVGGYGHGRCRSTRRRSCRPPRRRSCRRCSSSRPDDFAESWAWAQELMPALARRRDRRGHQRHLLVHAGRRPADGRVAATSRGFWLAEAVWVTHAAGVAPGDGRVARRRRRRATDLHECDINRFEAAPAGARVHPRPGRPELRRGLRHHPPAPADGGAAAAAHLAVLRARAGARGVLPRRAAAGSGRTGTRRTRRSLGRYDDRSRPRRLGRALLVPDRRRRGARDARRRRAVRHDLAQAARGRAGPVPLAFLDAADDQPPRPAGRARSSTP